MPLPPRAGIGLLEENLDTTAAMRAVVQRVRAARALVAEDAVGAVGMGLCVLLGVASNDDEEAARRLAGRVSRLRILQHEAAKLPRSVVDVRGEALVVSPFTLIADTGRGNRPIFAEAPRPDQAEPLYRLFCATLAAEGVGVTTGSFRARMRVEIENDGPVTIVLDG